MAQFLKLEILTLDSWNFQADLKLGLQVSKEPRQDFPFSLLILKVYLEQINSHSRTWVQIHGAHIKSQARQCLIVVPELRIRYRKIPRAHWQAILAKSGSPRFSEGPHLKRISTEWLRTPTCTQAHINIPLLHSVSGPLLPHQCFLVFPLD